MKKNLLFVIALLGLSISAAQAAVIVDTGTYTTNNQVDEFFFNVTGTGTVSVVMDTLADGYDADQVIWKRIPGDWVLAAWSPGALRPADSVTSGINVFGVTLKNGWVSGDVANQGTSDPGVSFTADAGEYLITTSGLGNFAIGSQLPGGLLSQGFLGNGNFENPQPPVFFNGDRDYTTTITGDFVVPASVVPVPAAVWLFGTALAGLGAVRRNKKAA